MLQKSEAPVLIKSPDIVTNTFKFTPEHAQEMFDYLCSAAQYFKLDVMCANQLGINEDCFVMGGWRDPESMIFVANPKVLLESKETSIGVDVIAHTLMPVKTKRPDNLRVRYMDGQGQVDTYNFSGMTARLYDQGRDMLMGISPWDIATRFHKEQATNQYKKLKKELDKIEF